MIPKALRFIFLALLVLLPAMAAMAQNTKGDTPAPRESRFKTPAKKSKKSKPARRIRMRKERPDPNTAITPTRRPRGERAGKPVRPLFQQSRPDDKQRAWKGDLTGRRIRPRATSGRARMVHPQPPTTNYSSLQHRRSGRSNENPNVRRVQRMQQQSDRQPQVGRPIRPTFHKTRPARQERAWRGDITGRRIRAQRSPGMRQSPSAPGIAGTRRATGRRTGLSIIPQSRGRAKNVFSQRSFYVNNQSQRRQGYRPTQRSAILGMFRQPDDGRRRGKVIPRSASAGFFRRKSINTWAHFPRQKRKGERAVTTDLAGHPLRMKNYETPRPEIGNPTLQYRRRVPAGDRAYKGPTGGYVSRTRSGKAWKGDVAHRKIRGGFRSKKGEPRPGIPLLGIGPGKNMRRAGTYQGNIKGRRAYGDQGETYTGNIRRRDRVYHDQGEGFSGNIRRRRGLNDQGESYTGNIRTRRTFNDQGESYTGNIRTRRAFRDQGESYTGNIKSRRPDKGGGSISGSWNNKGRPIAGRAPRREALRVSGYAGNLRLRRELNDQGEGYTGNIKATKPEKGGGSISGSWNNKGRAIGARYYSDHRRINQYSGNVRAERPEKGGGSVSGSWNNRGRPVEPRYYRDHRTINRYSGDLRAKSREPDTKQYEKSPLGKVTVARTKYVKNPNADDDALRVRKPGESTERTGRFTGNLKAGRYVRNPNSAAEALKVRRPGEGYARGGDFSGNMRAGRYVRNPNSASEALKVRKPGDGHTRGADYTGNMRRNWRYVRNPNAADEAMRVRKPDASYAKAIRYSGRTRRDWDYVRSPGSVNEALKTREPGRAFFRATAYQGNIRVKRFELFEKRDLHPDARFVRTNRNNVAGERDVMTNFRLWWARLFKKGDTQPDHLKEKDKDRKPRYDKGEQGLWYE